MHEIKLGDVTVTRVEETHGPIMPARDFFPTMPEEAWQEHRDLLVPDHLSSDDDLVHVAMQTWVLRSEGRTILIDTGIGNDKNRPAVEPWHRQQLDYLGRLAVAGVQPEDVDLVVNTHLHLDHVGWNTRLVDDEWAPTFPNATYLMPAADFHHWNPDNNPGIAGSINEYAFEDSIAPVRATGQVHLWEDSYVIDGNLRLEAAPGHTPGHAVIKLESGGERALFAADIIHTPLQLRHHHHGSCFCEDPVQAHATRRRLLDWAADTNALVLPAHISGRSALEIERCGESYAVREWAPFSRY
ncbi:MBL fold metallo-hydrolase [Microbispora cellulosiformans]|uniref:MBL fold metallo-hydrolase n=1 Tax=Microbispora cellulosiformans TaxID=2614688 RepID=A0A5J5JYW0_9ACTN|nr:MBL fold metallo-hydrolase [Microbispora cellulosiformans]KAA9376011.1 MBL fold metallo-hydrolase [Microbispora cellulosiformans]